MLGAALGSELGGRSWWVWGPFGGARLSHGQRGALPAVLTLGSAAALQAGSVGNSWDLTVDLTVTGAVSARREQPVSCKGQTLAPWHRLGCRGVPSTGVLARLSCCRCPHLAVLAGVRPGAHAGPGQQQRLRACRTQAWEAAWAWVGLLRGHVWPPRPTSSQAHGRGQGCIPHRAVSSIRAVCRLLLIALGWCSRR